MEFTDGGGGGGGGLLVTGEDNSYRTEAADDWIDSYAVVSSDPHRTNSPDIKNDVIASNLRDRFQQRRSGSNGVVKKVGAGSGWPNSKPDPGHEYKGCGLLVQMPRRWSSNISSFGSKIYDLSSNLFSRDHGNRYKPRQNIGNDDFEVIEKQELVRLQLPTSNGSPTTAKVAPPTTLLRGHRFVPVNLKRPNWCDKCSGFIWGVSKYCYICISGYYIDLLLFFVFKIQFSFLLYHIICFVLMACPGFLNGGGVHINIFREKSLR